MNEAGMLLCSKLQPISVEYANQWFTVRNRGGYFTTEPNQRQVVVLVVVNDEAVVLVKVKRPVISDITWELPAGGCDHTESLAEGAVRELYEEAGILVDVTRLTTLPRMSLCTNRHPVMPGIFKVDITLEEYIARKPHDDEVAEVNMFSLIEVKKMILDGRIYVATPALILSRLLLEKGV